MKYRTPHFHPRNLAQILHQELDQRIDPFKWLTSNGEDTCLSEWSPTIDIFDEENKYLIFADIPGVSPNDIEISLENGILTISGMKETGIKNVEKEFVREERFKGSFMRRFTLPDSIDGNHITAKCHLGVLEVIIPKNKQSLSRKIKVKE